MKVYVVVAYGTQEWSGGVYDNLEAAIEHAKADRFAWVVETEIESQYDPDAAPEPRLVWSTEEEVN